MMSDFPAWWIVGTDTEVGKTRVTVWAARHLSRQGLRVGVCKPAVSDGQRTDGGWRWEDIEALRSVCNCDVPEEWIGPHRWNAALAPPVAQRLEATGQVERSPWFLSAEPKLTDYCEVLDRWKGNCDILLVEGIGGLLCPLTGDATLADLIRQWQAPLLIVSRLGLGTLNHTLMTVEAAEHRGLNVAGVVLNATQQPQGLAEATNPEELRRRLTVPVWGPIEFEPPGDTVPPTIGEIDWRCGTTRPAGSDK